MALETNCALLSIFLDLLQSGDGAVFIAKVSGELTVKVFVGSFMQSTIHSFLIVIPMIPLNLVDRSIGNTRSWPPDSLLSCKTLVSTS